jgi:hypothetical protein
MLQRLKLDTKSEIENMCIMFWCLTSVASRTPGEGLFLPDIDTDCQAALDSHLRTPCRTHV